MAASGTRKPAHRLSWVGVGVAVVALLLAWYGSLHAEKHLAGSPLRGARGSAGLPAEPGPWWERLWDRAETTVFGERLDRRILALTERSDAARRAVAIVAYFLPFVLGLAAAWVGASAMKAIEQSAGRWSGNFQSVFAIMIGGFAAVIAGCMIFSVYLWPHVPAPYTT